MSDTQEQPIDRIRIGSFTLPEGNAVVFWGACLSLIAAGAAMLNRSAESADALAAATRYTARVSGLLFLLPLQGPAWLSKGYGRFGKWASRNQDDLLGAVAASHTVHAFAIYALLTHTGRTAETTTLVVGGLGYAFIYALAFLGGPKGNSGLDRAKVFGLYYVWFVFALTSSLATSTYVTAILFAAAMFAGLVNRFR